MADSSNYSKIIENQIESAGLAQQTLPDLSAEREASTAENLLAGLAKFLKNYFPDAEARNNISTTVQVLFWIVVVAAILVSVFKIWKYLEAKNLDKSQKIAINSQKIKKDFFKWTEFSLVQELDKTLLDKDYAQALRFRWMLFLKRINEKKYLTPFEFFYESKVTLKDNKNAASKNFQFWLFYYRGAFDPGMGDLMTFKETDRYLNSVESNTEVSS